MGSLSGLLSEAWERGPEHELPSPRACRELERGQLFITCPRPHRASALEEKPQFAVLLGRPKIRIPDTALEEKKNECSIEVALGSLPKLCQGLSLTLLWGMQGQWLPRGELPCCPYPSDGCESLSQTSPKEATVRGQVCQAYEV